MIRIISLLLSLPAMLVALFVANDAWTLGFIETFAAVLIIGFAVVAAGWTIRHDA